MQSKGFFGSTVSCPEDPRGGIRILTACRYTAMGMRKVSADYGSGSKEIVSDVSYNEFGQILHRNIVFSA